MTALGFSACPSPCVNGASDFPFRDDARTVVLVATGPSAGTADLEIVMAGGWPCVVINDAWRLAPWAHLLYACDTSWWRYHGAAVCSGFAGERWTQCEIAAREFGLRRIAGVDAAGLSEDPRLIYFNANSGAQAMNLAMHRGARRFVLVGYDMGAVGGMEHFFGSHPEPIARPTPYDQLLRNFAVIARDCERLGLPVVNASLVSRLTCFPKSDLASALLPS